ncbi:TIGR03936 family radical SAM-associated protein [Nostocoides sp.]|jgi:radical SAM-linked protein|uniref:TIGR03936 family radical SAM-associated protein n=1 Tax=Nostocoides sp. TaxID=1917966 RepID=UPI003BB0DA6B
MPAPTPDGPPPAPVAARYRIRYARRGRMRFSSTRDFARALERALRRAGVPMAFSAGFHPHPKISYAGGAPTGMASEAEYFEIGTTRAVDPELLRAQLDAALPTGLDVLDVVPAGPGGLAERLQASDWLLEFPEVTLAELTAAVTALMEQPEIRVSRVFKTGPRELDVKAAVECAVPGQEQGCAIIRLVVRHTTPAVRPDDVLTALRESIGFAPARPPRVTRLAQGPWDRATGQVADPLAPDKDAAASSR